LNAIIATAFQPWTHQLQLLQTIPGVGEKVAQVIIAESGSPGALPHRGPLRTVRAPPRRTRLKQAARALRVQSAGILRWRACSSRRQEAWIKRVRFPSFVPF